MPSRTWYLFIYQIPPRPLYLRAKIRQRLVKLGAVALKNSAYVLPAPGKHRLATLREVAKETIDGGGEAYICESRFVDDGVEGGLLQRATDEREADYRALLADIRKAAPERRSDVVRRLRARFEEIKAIDFASAPASRQAAAALDDLETHAGKARARRGSSTLKGKTWVTRKDIGIDRIGTAWLVRRFIDPKARFRFVAGSEVPRQANDLRFDMPDGDYTHERGRCTFEVVLAAARLTDPALRLLAAIVHDVDLGGRRPRRAESAGVAQMISGIVRTTDSDEERLTRGFELFDNLYRALSGE
jgi:hypothetical protein